MKCPVLHICAYLLVLLWGVPAVAWAEETGTEATGNANIICLTDVTASIETDIELPVLLLNTTEVAGFQFDVTIPDGLSVATDEDGLLSVVLAGGRTSTSAHTISASWLDEQHTQLRVVCVSKGATQHTFSGTSGQVAVLNVRAAVIGDFALIVHNVVITDLLGSTVCTSSLDPATLTVYLPGDANGDGYINVGDWASILAYVNAGNKADGLPSFDLLSADANDDGEVNVADISAVIEKILNGAEPMSSAIATMAITTSQSAQLQLIPRGEAVVGHDLLVDVCISNPDFSFSAFQFDLQLPAGFSLTVSSDEGKSILLNADRVSDPAAAQISATLLPEQVLRVVSFSTFNSCLLGFEGVVATLSLHIDSDAEVSEYLFTPTTLSLTATGQPLPVEPVSTSFTLQSSSSSVPLVNANPFAYKLMLPSHLLSLPSGTYLVGGRVVEIQ